jgi:hypothetical protein
LVGFNSYAGKIFSKNTFVSFEEVPYNFAYILPEGSQFDNTTYIVMDDIVLYYGYLKSPATVQQISLSRMQVTQDWQFGLWAEDIYGLPI